MKNRNAGGLDPPGVYQDDPPAEAEVGSVRAVARSLADSEALTAARGEVQARYEAMIAQAEMWPCLGTFREACLFVEWLKRQPGAECWAFEALFDGRVAAVFLGPPSFRLGEGSLGVTPGSSHVTDES